MAFTSFDLLDLVDMGRIHHTMGSGLLLGDLRGREGPGAAPRCDGYIPGWSRRQSTTGGSNRSSEPASISEQRDDQQHLDRERHVQSSHDRTPLAWPGGFPRLGKKIRDPRLLPCAKSHTAEGKMPSPSIVMRDFARQPPLWASSRIRSGDAPRGSVSMSTSQPLTLG